MSLFNQYRLAMALFHASLFAVAVHFGVIVLIGGSPIGPEVYGPAVYAVPALVWVAAQVGGEGIAAVGGYIGGRIGAAMMVFGSSVVLPFYGFLGAAASMTGQGVIVTAACLYVTSLGAVVSVIIGVGALRNERR